MHTLFSKHGDSGHSANEFGKLESAWCLHGNQRGKLILLCHWVKYVEDFLYPKEENIEHEIISPFSFLTHLLKKNYNGHVRIKGMNEN